MVTSFASSVNLASINFAVIVRVTLEHLTLSLLLLLCKTHRLSKKVIRTYYQVYNSFDFFSLRMHIISCPYFDGRIALFTA